MIPNGQTFTVMETTFRCYWVDGDHYEWISHDGQRAAGRIPGGPTCWARVGGRISRNTFPTLRSAMRAAVHEAAEIAA